MSRRHIQVAKTPQHCLYCARVRRAFGEWLGMGIVVRLSARRHARSSEGYKSGRNSWRDTPDTRSTSSTRSGGTSSHWATACLVICNEAANFESPPAASMARCRGVPDIDSMSSTTSHGSQPHFIYSVKHHFMLVE